MKKIVIKTMVVFLLFIIFSNAVFAGDFSWKSVFSDAQGFIDRGKGQQTGIDINSASGPIISIARGMVVIASIVLLVVTIIMALKYMMTNADGRAKLKIQLIGLVVSTIVIYGAQAIWAIVYKFMINLT